MKKPMLFILGLLFALALTGCSAEQKKFEIPDVQKMAVISVDGRKVEITDADTIRRMTDMVTSIPFEKGESSKQSNGFGPILQWYDAGGNVVESISVMGEQTINYDGYFWTALDGGIDTALLDELLDA